MKVTYDTRSEILRIRLSNVPIEESNGDKPCAILDYDEQGNVVGMEILDASNRT